MRLRSWTWRSFFGVFSLFSATGRSGAIRLMRSDLPEPISRRVTPPSAHQSCFAPADAAVTARPAGDAAPRDRFPARPVTFATTRRTAGRGRGCQGVAISSAAGSCGQWKGAATLADGNARQLLAFDDGESTGPCRQRCRCFRFVMATKQSRAPIQPLRLLRRARVSLGPIREAMAPCTTGTARCMPGRAAQQEGRVDRLIEPADAGRIFPASARHIGAAR